MFWLWNHVWWADRWKHRSCQCRGAIPLPHGFLFHQMISFFLATWKQESNTCLSRYAELWACSTDPSVAHDTNIHQLLYWAWGGNTSFDESVKPALKLPWSPCFPRQWGDVSSQPGAVRFAQTGGCRGGAEAVRAQCKPDWAWTHCWPWEH